MEKLMNKIVVVVRGGIVQEVYSKNIAELKIIDLDNDDSITEQEIKENIEGLISIEDKVNDVDKGKENTSDNEVWECCPHCDTEVKLEAIKYFKQVCPSCGVKIRPCTMCTEEEYSSDCRQCERIEESV